VPLLLVSANTSTDDAPMTAAAPPIAKGTLYLTFPP
jgi:hypothetical protein